MATVQGSNPIRFGNTNGRGRSIETGSKVDENRSTGLLLWTEEKLSLREREKKTNFPCQHKSFVLCVSKVAHEPA